MNIDYADIIQKANARKDALMEFERILAQSPEHAEQLRKSLSFFSELRTAVTALDTEAIALVRPYHDAVVNLTAKTRILEQSLNYLDPAYTGRCWIASSSWRVVHADQTSTR